MNIAIVGCGFVAGFYIQTLRNHPQLKLIGVMDRDPGRAADLAGFCKVLRYESLEQLLADDRVQIVLNLTNPRSHYEVSRACLLAGKHVYSEKPLATDYSQAEELVELAERKDLYLSSAPCNVLGKSAQTVWKALREKAIGPVRLVYAELDDGLVHRMRYRHWKSQSGVPWPYQDEFEVGCTLEHAGYYVTWLVAFFGPAHSVTAFASCQIPDKETDVPLEVVAPDFSVATIRFHSGVVARITCSIIAPHDHRLRIFGDDGVLSVEDCWNYGSPVYLKRRTRLSLFLERFPLISKSLGFEAKRYPMVKVADQKYRYRGTHTMDFARGVAELAAAIAEGCPPRLSSRFSLHVNEIVLTMQDPELMGCPRTIQTVFEPTEPLAGDSSSRRSSPERSLVFPLSRLHPGIWQ
jgi:predicted dehydrogenase